MEKFSSEKWRQLAKIILIIFASIIACFIFLYIKGLGEADKVGCQMIYEEAFKDSYEGIVARIGYWGKNNFPYLEIASSDGRYIHYTAHWEKHKELKEFISLDDSIKKIKNELLFTIIKVDGRKAKFKIPIKNCN